MLGSLTAENFLARLFTTQVAIFFGAEISKLKGYGIMWGHQISPLSC